MHIRFVPFETILYFFSTLEQVGLSTILLNPNKFPVCYQLFCEFGLNNLNERRQQGK